MTTANVNVGGTEALVDRSDVPLVLSYEWLPMNTRTTDTTYAKASGSHDPPILMHRLIMDAPAGVQVDHRNRNGLDNRRDNLRLATASQNGANRPKTARNTSGYKGVSWHRQCRKWRADLVVNRKQIYLGLFADPESAAIAYNAAAFAHFGEFAYFHTDSHGGAR